MKIESSFEPEFPSVDSRVNILEERVKQLEDRNNSICVFCGKEINKNIQPWNYYFPAQCFHLGCEKENK